MRKAKLNRGKKKSSGMYKIGVKIADKLPNAQKESNNVVNRYISWVVYIDPFPYLEV